MPTVTDIADWVPTLLDTNWHTAIESLRAQGVLVASQKPVFKPTGRRDATQSVKDAINVKVFEVTPEVDSRVTYGDKDVDTTTDWAVQFTCGGDYQKARSAVRQSVLVANRLFLLFRDNPHPEWQRIENVRKVHEVDYPDFQRKTLQFTLLRYGEPTPSSIPQVTT
jgi:hypothetical protein